jgi:hypothetical protein
MEGSFLIVLSFLLFSRFLGLFRRGVVSRHLDQLFKGAIDGQLFFVLVRPRFLLFCHGIKITKNNRPKNGAVVDQTYLGREDLLLIRFAGANDKDFGTYSCLNQKLTVISFFA